MRVDLHVPELHREGGSKESRQAEQDFEANAHQQGLTDVTSSFSNALTA
jgi:hypothetical protein